VNAEKGKTVAMNVIEGRVSETERQENERLTAVQNSIANVTNQLNTKYSVIDSLMKTQELDYSNAVSSYNQQMSNNIAIYNAALNIEESEKNDEQRATSTALSNAQIMLNAYSAAGLTYADLSSADKTNLTKLGVQSGLGADFFSNVLKTGAGKEVLTQIVSDDQTKVSIIYKDGTTSTISTGLSAKKTSSGGGGSGTSEEDKRAKLFDAFSAKAADLIAKIDSGDMEWGTAYDTLKTLYPDFESLIDETLGGGYDQAKGEWYGRAKS
jgi:hypothetical protein